MKTKPKAKTPEPLAPITWRNEKRKLKDLIKWEHNPRQISQAAGKLLAASLEEFSQIQTIAIEEDGTLVDGHQRSAVWTASDKFGPDYEVDVRVASRKLTNKERGRLVTLLHEGTVGDWNFDLVANMPEMDIADFVAAGFSEKVLLDEAFESNEPAPNSGVQLDKAAELNKVWKVKRGDRWAIGDHVLMCGDSTSSDDVKRCLNGAKPWLMVTDPPYGVNYEPEWRNSAGLASMATTGKVTNDNRANWASAYTRSGCEVAYVWHGGVHAAAVASDLIACGFAIRSLIIWAKTRFAIGRGDYHWAHEGLWYAVKEGCTGRFTGNRKNKTLWADIADTFSPKKIPDLYACQIDKDTIYAFPSSSSTVWTLPNDKQCEGGHSTQKPVECMARPIRNHGMVGDYVYDPFSGTGTTGIACQMLNRRARMMEVSADYCAVILQRFQDAYGITGTRLP